MNINFEDIKTEGETIYYFFSEYASTRRHVGEREHVYPIYVKPS